MANFYYGKDEGQSYWINLDHVCFVKPDPDKLILKMSDGNVVRIDGEDYDAFTEVLRTETVNWGTLFDEPPDDKRYNHEDIPSIEEVKQQSDWDDSDWDDDDDNTDRYPDEYPPTGRPVPLLDDDEVCV